MTKVVKSIANQPSVLKQRLNRFFFQHKNSGRTQVKEILTELANSGPVYLFGGAIRDIALQGIRNFYSDLDFVVDCNPAVLDAAIYKIAPEHKIIKNKFGGYRILCDKWWLDVWALESTWAFKQNIINFESVDSLLKTTILNWDAILFDFQHNRLIHNPKYFDELTSQTIDINLAENPNQIGAVTRVLRCLVSKPVKQISLNLQTFLNTGITQADISHILDYEASHYPNRYLDGLNLADLNQLLSQTIEPNLGYNSDFVLNPFYQKNLELALND